MSMPDFKPNNQKTHSFLKRLEIGTNLQTTRADYFFPTTTDFGLSLGYKLNDKSTVGIGGSYNVGWGQNINHIHVTSNGASLRSFVDIKLKKNIYFSGGYELNYQKAFTSFSQISSVSDWSRSGLLGLTKMVSLPGKVVKKTKVQIFWDFLSYYQVPRTQPIKFRIGYNF
jgi:long-subunit fatty acid transport protein